MPTDKKKKPSSGGFMKALKRYAAPKMSQPTGAGARRDAKLLKAEKEALGIKK